MRAYARQKQCKDSQKLNGYKKLPCILRENFGSADISGW